ncbi:hypothetical protein J6590_014329 [Homalodisca vitripennis]|nr:hypothetical protein J6590_014329 [Homalodisca vitripennis]
MTNVLWVFVLVLGGLWSERVAGGAVLERFKERLTNGRDVGGRLVKYREGHEPRGNLRTQNHRLVEFKIPDKDKHNAGLEDGDGVQTYSRAGIPKDDTFEEQLMVRGVDGKYATDTERTVVYKKEPGNNYRDQSRRSDGSNHKILSDYKRRNNKRAEKNKLNQRTVKNRIGNVSDGNYFQKDFDIETAFTESGNLLEFRARKDYSSSETTANPSQRRKEYLWTRDEETPGGVRNVLSDQPSPECISAPKDDSTIHAAVILPNSTEYIMALQKVMPVLRLAQEEVRRRQLLPKDLKFQFLPWDDRCDAVYAQIATFEAVKKDVHVFFGPACEYSVAVSFLLTHEIRSNITYNEHRINNIRE